MQTSFIHIAVDVSYILQHSKALFILKKNCKMASSGKKGKKSKGTVISLQSFLSKGNALPPTGTTQVAKKIRNFDGDDSDDSSIIPSIYQLPTAPRANRLNDDDYIPQNPPFIAYMTNLPFDIKESDISEYFDTYNVLSIRLPREDGETGRTRGFGYVEFESRSDIINALSLPDPMLKGRRIRIDFSNENEQNGNRHRGRRGFDNSNHNTDSNESRNWRRGNMNQEFSNSNNKYDRGFNRNKNVTPNSGNNSESWRSDERPKLNLKPRTLPLPERDILLENNSIPQPSKNLFGSAKPVDTAARDLAIEERIAETRKQEAEVANKLKDVKLDEPKDKPSTNTNSWRRKNHNSNHKVTNA